MKILKNIKGNWTEIDEGRQKNYKMDIKRESWTEIDVDRQKESKWT